MCRVGGAEWKILSWMIRQTYGYTHPGLRHLVHKHAKISIEDFTASTRLATQVVTEAIKKRCVRNAVKRRTQQDRRQRSFVYEMDPRANLKELPKPDPRRGQQALPSAPDFENQNLTEISKIKIPIGISSFENQNPATLVLRSRNKDQDLKKHTRGMCAEVGSQKRVPDIKVARSKFSYKQL